MPRVLITGGSGFLGSHVAAALAVRDDVELVVCGDLRHGLPRDGIIDETLDVTDSAGLAPLLRRHAIDTVVHLAAIVNPGRDVEQEYRVDVTGSANVLAACVEAGVRRMVVSSSGAAYGYHADNPRWIDEEQPLRGNDTFPYARHKRLVEEMLAEHRAAHPELQQVVFRIGTILGPTVRNQITALWDGRRILRIVGSASPFVFIWVDDVTAAMVRGDRRPTGHLQRRRRRMPDRSRDRRTPGEAATRPPGVGVVGGPAHRADAASHGARTGEGPLLAVPAGPGQRRPQEGVRLHPAAHEQAGLRGVPPHAPHDRPGETPGAVAWSHAEEAWTPDPEACSVECRDRAGARRRRRARVVADRRHGR